MSVVALALAGFVAMEAVSYAMHRWVMHGFGYAWHRSHHQPRRGRWEANDRFPLVFAGFGIMLFALGSGPWPALWWIGVGVTSYGIAYLTVHEILIHRRLPVRLPSNRYFKWLTEAHRDHHTGGDEPYGMLLPIVRRPRHRPRILHDQTARSPAESDDAEPNLRVSDSRRARL